MATDDRAEVIVSVALRRYLGAAVGPDGQWVDAPASRAIASLALEPRRARRWPRTSLVLAAALTLILAAAAILVSGGLTRPSVSFPQATSAPRTAPTAPRVDASPPPAAVVADPTPGSTPTPCDSGWSSSGTAPANGVVDGVRVVELDGSGGLFMVFGHDLGTVRRISIAPTQAPFVTSRGKTVKVAGNSFLKLTISGLNKATPVRDDMVSGVRVPVFTRTVGAPITEMRRIRTPVYSPAVKAPPKSGSTEVWILGLDYSPCIRVRTFHADGYGGDDTGDNALLVEFDRPGSTASPR